MLTKASHFLAKIGCGLAGSDWPDYKKILREFARANPSFRIVIYDNRQSSHLFVKSPPQSDSSDTCSSQHELSSSDSVSYTSGETSSDDGHSENEHEYERDIYEKPDSAPEDEEFWNQMQDKFVESKPAVDNLLLQ